jgi:hypothetical protein
MLGNGDRISAGASEPDEIAFGAGDAVTNFAQSFNTIIAGNYG